MIAVGLLVIFYYNPKDYAIDRSEAKAGKAQAWNPIMAKLINEQGITLRVDGKMVRTVKGDVIYDDDMELLIAADILTDVFNCASNFYSSNHLVLRKFNNRVVLSEGQSTMMMDEESVELASCVKRIGDRLYVPAQVLERGLFYFSSLDSVNSIVSFSNARAEEKIYPYAFDYREEDRVPQIKNQSTFGTCWAFASLMALETTLRPEICVDFSEDHMSINNNFNMSQNDGGDYNMAIAYLASWTGPVYEEDDPYGDGISPNGLKPVMHIQEAQILESKNYDSIKRAVFLYGGVQSSIYLAMTNSESTSSFYNKSESSYCYIGPKKPNHDIVIIGWDDAYPASAFTSNPEGDGAFICANSWGDEFGDNGVFYVSYYDSNIGVHNVIYTGIEPVDNYDNIYQTDLCGWVGQIGYDREYAYFANVYEAQDNERLEAVGFYATAGDTSYEVYFVDGFEGERSFADRVFITKGSFSNAGYYTVKFPQAKNLEKGKKYAVIVYINSPNTKRPVAVEYAGDTITSSVSIDDGEGYISPHGDIWIRVETTKQCNVCLKMYTNNR